MHRDSGRATGHECIAPENRYEKEYGMRYTRAIIFLCIAVLSIILITGGDRLPNQTPENQIYSIDTTLDVIGTVKDTNTMSWVVASPNAIPTGIPGEGQSVSDTIFIDSIMTNGGKLSENKNFDFNSKNPGEGVFNIENQKVLTYASTNGSHMVGEEEYTLSVAGNYSTSDGNIRCVFSQNTGFIIPAFCNIVSAKSALVNINNAQISSKGQIRSVAETIDVPTALNYRLATSPDLTSGRRYAEGGVKTIFAGSSLEARDGGDANYLGSASDGTSGTWNKTSLVRSWKDSTTVFGQIRNVQKNFDDPSELGSMFTPPVARETPAPVVATTVPTTVPMTTVTTVVPTPCPDGYIYVVNNYESTFHVTLTVPGRPPITEYMAPGDLRTYGIYSGGTAVSLTVAVVSTSTTIFNEAWKVCGDRLCQIT
nr:hypothetical protein [uncultured Methanospirillum sp.]